MWSFLKTKSRRRTDPRSRVDQLRIDLQAHVLPGIDDGAKTMAESLALLRRLEAMGFAKLITNPHVMADAYPNSRDTILAAHAAVQQAMAEEGITMALEASAEYYLDEGFVALLEAGELIPIAGQYILFETSYMARPMAMEEMIFRIQSAGYTPILAHPERYRYITNPEDAYRALKDAGVLFQIDTNSLGGFYGKSAQKKAEFLSRKGWIDFTGSDTHRMRHLDQLEETLSLPVWDQLFADNDVRNRLL